MRPLSVALITYLCLGVCLAGLAAWAQEPDEEMASPEAIPADEGAADAGGEEYVEGQPEAEVEVMPEEAEPVVEEEPVEPDIPPPPVQPPRPQRPMRPMRRPVAPGAPSGTSQPGPDTTQMTGTDQLTPLGRPMPGLPVDQYRPKSEAPAASTDAAAQDSLISFDYENTDLLQVIKAIGARTGKNFDIDPQLAQAKVTIITHAPIPVDMAYEVLESILSMRGFEIVPVLDGQLHRIRPASQDTDKKKVYIGRDKQPVGFDTVATHVVPVLYADATELAQLLPTLGSATARVDAYGKTNTLIMTDTADGIRNMLQFLDEVDKPGFDTEMEILILTYTRAEVISQQIQDVLLGGEGAAAGPTTPGRTVPQRPVRPTTVPGKPQSTVVGSYEEILRIVPDERLNALIVVATPELMERVLELVKLLDTPTPTESNNLHVYELLNADAAEVEEALNGILSLTPRKEAQKGAATGAGGGGAGDAEVTPFEQKVQVTSYEQTNSLLVVASPQDYKTIKELIAQLDVPQRQVHVAAIIMEVIINDNFSLSVELAGLTGNDGFGLSNVVDLANILTQGPLAAVGDGGAIAGIIDGTTEITTVDATGNLVLQEIPNIPLLLNALESITEVDVLSQPGLTTKDNVQASVVVGLEVPYITGSSRSLDQSAVGSSVFSRVERKDTGIKLNVTPQITEGDYVSMELEVEVSQPVASAVGADPNIVGPTFQKSNITTEAVIKDGSTGIVGGLIRESTDRSIRQPPYLGDLPGLGWLFRRKDNQRAKRNLVILVTPHIIKEGLDMERVTDFRVNQFSEANVDVLFEKGYIRKIGKRHYMRNEHRPSKAPTEELSSKSRFRRGDMQRESE